MNNLTMTLEFDKKLAEGETTTDEIAHYLLTHHYKELHRLVRNLLNDADAADDVVQTTIIKVSQKIEQYRPNTNFKAWVYKIAINEAKSTHRRRQSRFKLSNLWKNAQTSITYPSPENEAITSERKRQLWLSVNQLKEKHRTPIILRYLHNLTPREIADVLDVPVGTIHSRLHYAHNKLFGLLVSEEVAS